MMYQDNTPQNKQAVDWDEVRRKAAPAFRIASHLLRSPFIYTALEWWKIMLEAGLNGTVKLSLDKKKVLNTVQ